MGEVCLMNKFVFNRPFKVIVNSKLKGMAYTRMRGEPKVEFYFENITIKKVVKNKEEAQFLFAQNNIKWNYL